MEFNVDLFNGLAGLAALVNSLFMWPVIRSLKKLEPRVAAHAERITKLEKHVSKRKRKRGSI